jgi:predicted permease
MSWLLRARGRIGHRPLSAESTGGVWRWGWFDDLRRDVRLAARLLLKQWRFSALAILVLALGTGANTTIFSVANALLFKPLPVQQPERLAWIYGGDLSNIPHGVYRDYRDAMTTVTGLAGFGNRATGLRVDDVARVVSGQVVTGNYFDVLGIRPWAGRLVRASDAVAGGSREVVVISHQLWQRQFDGDHGVVGRTVGINGRPFEVVGVAPPRFHGVLIPFGADLWIPAMTPGAEPPSLHVIGRMSDGATARVVAAEVSTLRERFARTDPDRHVFETMTVIPASGQPPVMGAVAPFVFPLLGLVTLALLVACFNLASLLLARSSARGHEVGVRLALGAGRGRIVRQLLTESVLLTVVGAAVGLMLARWVSGVLSAVSLPLPELAAMTLDVDVDWRVFLFASGSAVVAVLTFGVTPALQTTRVSAQQALGREASALGGRRSSRIRAVLISAQLALSVVLLTATGLLLQSWRNAVTTDLGFDPEPVLAVGVNPAAGGYDGARRQAFYQALAEQLPSLPGAMAASAVEIVPLTMSSRTALLLKPGEEEPPLRDFAATAPRSNTVTPGYFETLGIPLLAGRDFAVSDGPAAAGVTIVDDRLANRLWPGENPLGRRLRRLTGPLPLTETEVEVVGVVANAKYATVGEVSPAFAYFPLLQANPGDVTILIRGLGDPLGALPAVRDLLGRVDPNIPIMGENRLSALTALSLIPVSAAGVLVGAIGMLTVLLAAIGVTGVLMYLVRQRTAEIGLRMALGASAPTIARLVVGQSARWMLVGLCIGVTASVALSRFVGSFLYGVSPTEPAVIAVAAMLLTLVGALASLIPARRAWRIDPMSALRTD